MHAGHVRKIYLMDKGEPIPSAIRSSGKYVNHSILSILLPFPHPINWNISQHDTLKQGRQWKHSTLAMCVGKRSSRGFFVNIESTVIPDFFLWFQLQCGSRQKRNLSVPMPTELKSNKKLSLVLLTEVYLSSFDFFFFPPSNLIWNSKSYFGVARALSRHHLVSRLTCGEMSETGWAGKWTGRPGLLSRDGMVFSSVLGSDCVYTLGLSTIEILFLCSERKKRG